MPEGPEIRLAADCIAKVLVGQVVENVHFGLPSLKRFEKRLTGCQVTAIDTRGKAMLTRFANGLTLYSHNQLYGKWFTTRRPNLPRTSRQLRVALHTATHSALLYSASDIEVLTERGIRTHLFLNRAGPDILDRRLRAADIADRLMLPQFRNRAVSGLYLDQAFLAGNGNYLRSEILYAARVNPRAKPAGLHSKALNSLAKQTLTIARRSYRTRGITAPPAAARRRKAQGQRYSQYRFQVFAREGLSCYACDATIERHLMSSRNLFLCPVCQAAH